LCASLGVDPQQAISERHLCAVVILYARSHRITTVSGFVSAVQHYALRRGHPSLPRGHTYQRVRAGLDNWYGDTNFSESRTAITIDDLCEFHAHLDMSVFADARDWCACLFAFYGLLRIKEYTCGGLRIADVTPRRWGIRLTIPFSKTSVIPTTIDIVRRDDQLCPLIAYHTYWALLPVARRSPPSPFFVLASNSSSPLTDTQFIRHVRLLVRTTLHRDAREYAGHSFRRGGTSALLLAGVPEATIALHGRWRSLAYRGYIDVKHSQRLRLAATAQLRLCTGLAPPATASMSPV
jgi:hypothetical protein